MIAIYAYTQRLTHYKPLNDEFIRLATLSVKSTKKHYKTKLYCDEQSLEFFAINNIIFDEVVIIDGLVNDYPSVFSMSKIYAMIHETEPYLLLDFDVVLLEKLTPTHTVTYGHPEVQINSKYIGLDSLLYTYNVYLKPFNEHIRKYFTSEDLTKIDWLTYPSFCVVMVQNPVLIREVYNDILNNIEKEDIGKIPTELLEQFLCHQKLVKYKVDYGFLSMDHFINDSEFDVIDLMSKKYLHLNINNNKIEQQISHLEQIFS